MLAASVNACKRLLVKKANHIMLLCNLLHNLHCELVMVGCNVCCCEDGSKLMLSGSNLVMLGFCKNAELPELLIEVFHESRNSGLDCSEIMVVKLLTLG